MADTFPEITYHPVGRCRVAETRHILGVEAPGDAAPWASDPKATGHHWHPSEFDRSRFQSPTCNDARLNAESRRFASQAHARQGEPYGARTDQDCHVDPQGGPAGQRSPGKGCSNRTP
ncbi:hypothetical protein THIOKS13070002 [Thiocapsa sp. KS1]|nr:hypothetical protein THIOKS13070002 [Thiocapsa sp. KS1]